MFTISPVIQIEQPSIKEKKNWLKWAKSINKESEIVECALDVDQYFETSCILTAAVIRKRLTDDLNWKVQYTNLTPDFIASHHLFQIEFGFDYHFSDHIMTVCDGVIYQSFWKQTSWDVRPLVLPDDFDSTKDSMSPKMASKIIGFEMTDYFNAGFIDYRILLPPE